MLNPNKFKPTTAMIHAAKAVFLTKAYADTVRPIVRGYQQRILDYEKYEYDEKYFERREKTPKDWIKDPKDTFLMRDTDFQHYIRRCREEQAKAKLKTSRPDNCPLLEAENEERKAKRALIEAMEPITRLSVHKVLCSGLAKYEKFVELSLRLIAPYVERSPVPEGVRQQTNTEGRSCVTFQAG